MQMNLQVRMSTLVHDSETSLYKRHDINVQRPDKHIWHIHMQLTISTITHFETAFSNLYNITHDCMIPYYTFKMIRHFALYGVI